jgi:hypothetical protein
VSEEMMLCYEGTLFNFFNLLLIKATECIIKIWTTYNAFISKINLQLVAHLKQAESIPIYYE